MKPEQQRIAIAEACGWKYDPRKLLISGISIEDSFPWITPIGDRAYTSQLPDYLNDLNAMHEAEKVMLDNYGTWTRYAAELKIQSAKNGLPHFHLTASQRAEAFLRTLNLWTS